MIRRVYNVQKLRKLVQEILCSNRRLTFDEVYSIISSKLHEEGLEVPPKYHVRVVLAELVREGVVVRLPDYGSSKMVFACTSS